MKYLFLLIVVFSLCVACSKNESTKPEVNPENLLLGIWVNSQYTDTGYIMTRSRAFIDEFDGFEFKADSSFVQRINSDGCGTPPVTYANYKGKWSFISENLLLIETTFWGGNTTYEMEIIKVDDNQLVYRLVYPL